MYIEIDGVSKQFMHNKTPILALQNVNLNIEKGEFICFLGPSGCGKTTLLNMLAGYDKPTSGEIRIEGAVVDTPSIKRATVFQGYDLLPWRTAQKNVEIGLESLDMSKEERKTIADKYLDMVGLTDFANHFPSAMSGGMRQRVSIARVLAVNPEVIYMDEPFSALDLISRLAIQKSILGLWRESKKTIIFVTHIIDEAILLSNRIVIFSPYPGRIVHIIDVPPNAKKGDDMPEYIKIKDEIHRVCEISI
ncbi:MAG: ABC transporter ATP-binding protein [Defluviitaleaceae bacterium]|nr:ABC transporter ATP-binding protein [Defluviitaleaceae bacterium]MCL2262436.1 ABC transporter ATP-binding protein [Defluviitaleaceae bacterium]